MGDTTIILTTGPTDNDIVVSLFDKMLNGQPIESRGILNGQLNGQLKGQLNEGQQETLNYIIQHQGCNTTIIAKELGKPFRTVDKHVRVLLSLSIIERRGSKKTGGYYRIIKNDH